MRIRIYRISLGEKIFFSDIATCDGSGSQKGDVLKTLELVRGIITLLSVHSQCTQRFQGPKFMTSSAPCTYNLANGVVDGGI